MRKIGLWAFWIAIVSVELASCTGGSGPNENSHGLRFGDYVSWPDYALQIPSGWSCSNSAVEQGLASLRRVWKCQPGFFLKYFGGNKAEIFIGETPGVIRDFRDFGSSEYLEVQHRKLNELRKRLPIGGIFQPNSLPQIENARFTRERLVSTSTFPNSEPSPGFVYEQPWIESLQLGSERPDYFTYYLSTYDYDRTLYIALNFPKDDLTRYGPLIEELSHAPRLFRFPLP